MFKTTSTALSGHYDKQREKTGKISQGVVDMLATYTCWLVWNTIISQIHCKITYSEVSLFYLHAEQMCNGICFRNTTLQYFNR